MEDGVEIPVEVIKETKVLQYNFPRMIYHLVEGNKIVETQTQFEQHLKQGWTKSPQDFSQIEALKLKIKQHEDELEVMLENLETLQRAERDKVKEVKAEKQAAKVAVVEETKEVVTETTAPVVEEVKKPKTSNRRRGR